MAKRRASSNNHSAGTSKADLIRAVARESDGPVRPRDVISTLAERGVTASSAQVSQVLAAMGLRRRRRKGAAAAAPAAGARRSVRRGSRGAEMLQLDHLVAAKHLCEKVGGIEAAKTALDALAKLA
ncbi:MAG TPA: hypothetical protein VFW87_16900 [Pirellulales bacterium]|nr:hypothetical protein [Pirellulales bacterium]